MPTSVTQERIRTVVSEYLARISTGTSETIAALYAVDATLEDPVGSEPRTGRPAIADFYRGLDDVETSAELITVRIAGYTAAFHFRVTTTLPGTVVVVDPIDVMTFDDDGLITSMRAIWSPEDTTMTPRS